MKEISFDSEKIKRYFTGDGSDDDASYTDEVFCDENKEKDLEHFLRKQWYELLRENDSQEKNLDKVLYKIHYEINTSGSKYKNTRAFGNILRWSARIAAILILPLAIYSGIYFYKSSNQKNITWTEIKAPAWTRAQFSLPDGTTGWLNSNSSIRYKGNFIDDRQVTFTGEAFFDVFKDEKNPFKVIAEDITIKVLGTRFSIASYENENNIEVVLEEGGLILKDREKNKSYTMRPNDLIVYDKVMKSCSTEKVEPHKYLSWTEGKLVFRNDPLDVIARRLERWYNIDVEFEDKLANGPRLRATFIDENLEEVLYFLKQSLQIEYRIIEGSVRDDGIYSKKKVIISHKK